MAFVKVAVATVGDAVVTVKLDVMVETTLELEFELTGGVTNVRTDSELMGMFLLAGDEALSLDGMELAHT